MRSTCFHVGLIDSFKKQNPSHAIVIDRFRKQGMRTRLKVLAVLPFRYYDQLPFDPTSHNIVTSKQEHQVTLMSSQKPAMTAFSCIEHSGCSPKIKHAALQ